MEKENNQQQPSSSTVKLRALRDVWINGGSTLIKKGEIFEKSCKQCVKDMVANGQAEIVNPE
ncbi:hypothetical protein SAMN05192529_13121 [Arachidicoccus rhizosphaerae]|uniref:Uncharacterized protein n=1 Tax=Arachidicoccus rhizosphaerae TaxID=551991 RepID=A0A1H4CF29_9BACT|nr:hypothetical protein [Arachidicoccus rhizosphaerae]SEA59035.1 hypothetical protein SAMN05192529_13121 [Arachidicoccus rhizosphaerae]